MEANSVVERIVEDFLKRRYMLDMGKGKLAKYLKCSEEEVVAAKKIAKRIIQYGYVNQVKKSKLPKILIFDLESSPMISYHFGHWKQNIGLDQVIHNPILLTWSAKWLFSPEIHSDSITPEEVLNFDDKRITTTLWLMINEADIVVAHYGQKFDEPLMNARFLINGLPPVSPYVSIDTKAIASRQFKFPSNKLDALAIYFGFERKLSTDFMLWRRCMEGDLGAIQEMLTYNKQDVYLLEEVYLKLRPYIHAHPNLGLYLESEMSVCANCGSSELSHESEYYTQTGKYDVYRCQCGALNRVRSSSVKKDVRRNLLVSTGR